MVLYYFIKLKKKTANSFRNTAFTVIKFRLWPAYKKMLHSEKTNFSFLNATENSRNNTVKFAHFKYLQKIVELGAKRKSSQKPDKRFLQFRFKTQNSVESKFQNGVGSATWEMLKTIKQFCVLIHNLNSNYSIFINFVF